MITIVTGLPRSGTSLMMKMLVAGGMFFCAEEFPCFETPLMLELKNNPDADHSWLKGCDGACVKIIEPDRYKIPKFDGFDYRFIWLRRNWYQIGKSQVKCLDEFWPGPTRRIDAKAIKALKQKTADGLKAVRELGEVLSVRFEDLINKPADSCRKIADFIDYETLDTEAMNEIILDRPTAALPQIEELNWGFKPSKGGWYAERQLAN